MEKMSQLSEDALILISRPEQAKPVAELEPTEILQGMSEEQILPLAAEKSPEVAGALREKFHASPRKESWGYHERLLEPEGTGVRRWWNSCGMPSRR